jgi:hypothetical protein
MDEKFETVWQALVENGSSKRNHDATERFWNTLTPRQQNAVFTSIPRKVKEGKFVQYDPIRAIKENARLHKLPEPTNYNGRALKHGVQYVIAKYKGSYGTYTLDDALSFGMEIKEGLNFKYTFR